MSGIVLNEPKQQITLSKVNLPIPECADNELLIKVEYAGLNCSRCAASQQQALLSGNTLMS